MDDALTVSVVIVSWNASKYLEECLLSLDEASYPWPIQIIVVDNASSDDSSAMVRARFPHVKLIQNSANLGFAKANNIGIQASTGNYVALVNSDVHVLHDCLQQLVAYAEANPRAGIVGPYVIGGDGKQQISYRGFPRLWNMFCRALALDRLFPNVRLFTGYLSTYRVLQSPTPVEILSGCFMIVKREAIAAVGLLDEAFFIYGEDMDWCKRFGQKGWSVVFVPAAQSNHYGGASSSNSPVRFFVEMQRADLQYWRKHHSRLAVAAYLGLSVLHHVLRIFGHWLASIVVRNQSGSHLQRAQRSSMCLKWILSNAGNARTVS